MARPARVSPDRILAAAAAEFAARGYAGARVDRIARRARVNKAMLYYHFGSKADLYRALLRRTFELVAARLRAIADTADPPPVQIHRVIGAMAELMREQPAFPAIMLRELAEGGARLDAETVSALAAVPRTVGAIIERGIERGDFRPVNPLAAYFGMIAPIVMYLAGAPIRSQLARRRDPHLPAVAADAFVQHLQEATQRALARTASAHA